MCTKFRGTCSGSGLQNSTRGQSSVWDFHPPQRSDTSRRSAEGVCTPSTWGPHRWHDIRKRREESLGRSPTPHYPHGRTSFHRSRSEGLGGFSLGPLYPLPFRVDSPLREKISLWKLLVLNVTQAHIDDKTSQERGAQVFCQVEQGRVPFDKDPRCPLTHECGKTFSYVGSTFCTTVTGISETSGRRTRPDYQGHRESTSRGSGPVQGVLPTFLVKRTLPTPS